MCEGSTHVKRAITQLMTVLLGNNAEDKDCEDMYKSLKEGGLIRDTELAADTVMFNLERIFKSHSELEDTMADVRSLLKDAGKLYHNAVDKVLGSADRINSHGVDIERFIVKIADYYVDMLAAAKTMFICIQSNLDVMATLEHSVVIGLDMPSIVWDASTDAEDIAFVVGSKKYAMSFAKQIMEKVGE